VKPQESVADIGVFGGSGFYSLLEDPVERTINTPYGHTSDRIAVGEIDGKRVAFMPRHGVGHKVPAHRVNYRANVWAMWNLGVKRILGPCAAGSLQSGVRPGDFVICDQFVDRTSGRPTPSTTGRSRSISARPTPTARSSGPWPSKPLAAPTSTCTTGAPS
jgi:5'-methylthioadenosine phosphorylase